MQYFFGIGTFLTSLFLILLILIQRGRGGGLAGALGGMGGQSAFGTKAGDLFTRVTIGVAAVWILLSVAAISVLNKSHSVFGEGGGSSSVFSTGKGSALEPDAKAKSDGSSATDGKDPGLEAETKKEASSATNAAGGKSKETPAVPGAGAAPAAGAPAAGASAPAAGASAPAARAEKSPAAAPPANTPGTSPVTPPTSPDKK